MVLGKLDSHMQKNETRHSLTPHTKINSKWLKDLIVRLESIKILEENTGNTFLELGHSNFLQHTSRKARETKAKLLGLNQDKKLLHSKETVNKTDKKKTTYRMGEDICK